MEASGTPSAAQAHTRVDRIADAAKENTVVDGKYRRKFQYPSRPETHKVTIGYLTEKRPCLHCDNTAGYVENSNNDSWTCRSCGAHYLPTFEDGKAVRGIFTLVR
jgi:ribosomal protein L37AE/L43A